MPKRVERAIPIDLHARDAVDDVAELVIETKSMLGRLERSIGGNCSAG